MRKRRIEEMDHLMDFSCFNNLYNSLANLEQLAQKESWKYKSPNHGAKNLQNPILENYVHHTFRRLLNEYRSADDDRDRQSIIYHDKVCACFNTGLFTENYGKIYGLFYANKNGNDSRPYFFYGFVHEADQRLSCVQVLPRRANYFSDISDLIYNPTLEVRASFEHILQENKARFPSDLQDAPYLSTLFTGAVEIAQKRVQANYKVAVPTYYRKEICLLLPICLKDQTHTDLALAVKKNEGFYTAKTCLTLDMAYNDARLIAKPDVDWLSP